MQACLSKRMKSYRHVVFNNIHHVTDRLKDIYSDYFKDLKWDVFVIPEGDGSTHLYVCMYVYYTYCMMWR